MLAPAKTLDEMQAIVTNSTVDGVLAALFAVLIIVVIVDALADLGAGDPRPRAAPHRRRRGAARAVAARRAGRAVHRERIARYRAMRARPRRAGGGRFRGAEPAAASAGAARDGADRQRRRSPGSRWYLREAPGESAYDRYVGTAGATIRTSR